MAGYPPSAHEPHPHPLTLGLGFLLFLALIPALYTLPVERVLLQPEPYERAVALQQPDERMADWLVDGLTTETSSLPGDLATQTRWMERVALSNQILASLPDGWSAGQASRILRGALAYLNFESDVLDLQVDLVPLSNSWTAYSQNIASAIVSSWPPCSAELLLELSQRALQGDLTEVPYCQPGEFLQPLVEQVVAGGIRLTASALPQSLDIDALLGWKGEPAWSPVYRVARTLLRFAPWLAAALLLLIGLLNGGERRAPAAEITGQAGVFAGLTVLVLQGAGLLLFQPVARWLLGLADWALPNGWLDFLQAVLWTVLVRFSLSVALWAGFAVLLGFGLILLARVRQPASLNSA
jgi:hypothetical protein